MRKNPLPCLLALLLAVCLTACGGEDAELPAETDWTVSDMAEFLRRSQADPLEMTLLLPGDGQYETYLTANYRLEAVEDGAILCAGGTSAQEIAVLRTAEGQAAVQALRDYAQARTDAFTGYLPDEAALLENARVLERGAYVALLVCPDQDAAEAAFAKCFTDPPPEFPPDPEPELESAPEPDPLPEPGPAPEIEPDPEPTPEPESDPVPEPDPVPWQYTPSRLLAAWEAGDWTALPEQDRVILDGCAEVLAAETAEDFSDYEKELAVHDWMIAWAEYDSNTLSQLPDFAPMPDNDNPYGFFTGGRAICRGYASTFQLFMDLLGIECVTVEGTSRSGTSEHAWNMVQLDGDWYCVDVTWDDPVTNSPVTAAEAHRYFNVTSRFLRQTDHQWDKSTAVEARGTTYRWQAD